MQRDWTEGPVRGPKGAACDCGAVEMRREDGERLLH